MPDFDQHSQNVNKQYNAGSININNEKEIERLRFPTEVKARRTATRDPFRGDTLISKAEFMLLGKRHKITCICEGDKKLLKLRWKVKIYRDDQVIFNITSPFIGTLEKEFKIDGIDCKIIFKVIFVAYPPHIYVAGDCLTAEDTL